MRKLGSTALLTVALTLGAAAGGDAAPAGQALPKGEVADFAVDAQGRAVAALPTPTGTRPWVVRLSAGGLLDPAFAGGGVLRPPVEGPSVQIAVRDDGALVVAGSRGRGTTVLRYGADGARDRGFGENGSVRLPRVAVEKVLQQPQGGIVVLGITSCPRASCGYLYNNLQVVRLAADGRILRHLNVSHEAWHFSSAAVGPRGWLQRATPGAGALVVVSVKGMLLSADQPPQEPGASTPGVTESPLR